MTHDPKTNPKMTSFVPSPGVKDGGRHHDDDEAKPLLRSDILPAVHPLLYMVVLIVTATLAVAFSSSSFPSVAALGSSFDASSRSSSGLGGSASFAPGVIGVAPSSVVPGETSAEELPFSVLFAVISYHGGDGVRSPLP